MSSCWWSCSDVRLSSLASLSRVLSSLLASELLSWTRVRSPSRWLRVSVVSLICALQNINTNHYFGEISAALNSFHVINVIMWFRDLNVKAGFFIQTSHMSKLHTDNLWERRAGGTNKTISTISQIGSASALVPEVFNELHETSDSRGGGVARVDNALSLR